jgi:hypothetical protein
VAISGCLELLSFATFFGHLFEAIGDHNKAALLSLNPARKLLILLEATGDRHVAALLSMNPARKLLILVEPVTSSLRGAKRRGNLRLPRVEDVCVCKNAILARGYERSCVVPTPPEVGSWLHLSMQAYNKLAMTR